MRRVRGVEDERRERRRGRHDRVAEHRGQSESRSVAAAFRQGLSAGREHDGARLDLAVIGRDAKPWWRSVNGEHAAARHQLRARRVCFAQQRLEHVTGAVRVWKEFAAGFFVQPDADRIEDRVP